ncbi:MAG: AcrR family transcriptional regulator [Bermanella sp.]|jgi:AcrR family transcriptional regulator
MASHQPNALSRKDQVRLEREELILSVALSLLKESGLNGLTMQAIADRTEYSKGTIYQHFSCKEDVLAKLVIRCGQRLISLIDLALANSHGLRHKVVMVSWAFFINAELESETASLVSMVKSPEFQTKISDSQQEDLSIIDQSILSRVIGLFTQQTDIGADKVKVGAFGWWAMKWGVQDVLMNDWEMSKLGFDDPKHYFFESLHVFLDGLGVQRDEFSHDFEKVQAQAKQIFR